MSTVARGFNGAADRSRRKAATFLASSLARVASMEPPTEVGGRVRSSLRRRRAPTRFNGAADRSRRKAGPRVRVRHQREASMEPPTEVGGRSRTEMACDAHQALLQWSRRPKSAEGMTAPPIAPPMPIASMEPPTEVGGRLDHATGRVTNAQALQWSRRPKSAEGSACRASRHS